MFAAGETVTRLRAPVTTNAYNATERNWSLATTTTIPGWAVDDSASDEPVEVGRQAIVTDFTLYRQDAVDLQPSDRLIVRGLTCEVIGRPSTPINPFTGWTPGMVVKVKVVEG